MAILNINGVDVKDPSDMTVELYDITKATRNSLGVMTMEIVRKDVTKLVCKWSYMKNSEALALRNAVSDVFNLEVFVNGSTSSINMYIGNRTLPIYSYRKGSEEYKDVVMNLIEM